MYFNIFQGSLSYFGVIQTILSQPSLSQPSKVLIWILTGSPGPGVQRLRVSCQNQLSIWKMISKPRSLELRRGICISKLQMVLGSEILASKRCAWSFVSADCAVSLQKETLYYIICLYYIMSYYLMLYYIACYNILWYDIIISIIIIIIIIITIISFLFWPRFRRRVCAAARPLASARRRRDCWIPFGDHPWNFERSRED